MDMQLAGKRALVTGSTLGIGYATALGLYREGASVILNGRDPKRVAEAVARLKAEAGPHVVGTPSVEGIAADLGTAAGAAAVTAAVPDADILVNNVGIFAPSAFEDVPDSEWQRFFDVNIMSGVRLSRHYLPRMKASNWGRIVFISSESAVQIPPEMIHYGMTKTAQLALSRGLAETTAGTGVTVNAVLPGPTDSEGVGAFVADLAKQRGVDRAVVEAEFFQNARPTSIIKRFATVTEVANMIVYVCSPCAAATNGAALRVDGGIVRSIV